MKARAFEAFDFSDNPALRGFGLDQQSDASGLVGQSLQALLESGWLAGNEHLSVTTAGREHLKQMSRRTRGESHRLATGR